MSEDLLEVSGGCYCGGVRYRAKGVMPQFEGYDRPVTAG